MKVIVQLAERLKSLKISGLLKVLASNKEFTDLIIELNTRKQLFDEGIDSTGRLLSDIGGNYSPNTIEGTSQYKGKKAKGLPYDHITLFDTGQFYQSFEVFLRGTEFVISANTLKDTTDLVSEWGANILGLTEKSLSILREKAKDILIPYIRKKLLTR
ncbi:MAG: hypothetical protein V4538_15595 [Bacteroidota bacterium]